MQSDENAAAPWQLELAISDLCHHVWAECESGAVGFFLCSPGIWSVDFLFFTVRQQWISQVELALYHKRRARWGLTRFYGPTKVTVLRWSKQRDSLRGFNVIFERIDVALGKLRHPVNVCEQTLALALSAVKDVTSHAIKWRFDFIRRFSLPDGVLWRIHSVTVCGT